MSTTNASMLAVATLAGKMDEQYSGSWFGMVGRLVLFLINVVPGILYWLVTFTTITMPSFLFGLFSTSLTFTMNATTL
jgi:lysophospholipid hydrolase